MLIRVSTLHFTLWSLSESFSRFVCIITVKNVTILLFKLYLTNLFYVYTIRYYYGYHTCSSEDVCPVPPCSFVNSMTLTVEENDFKNCDPFPHCPTQLIQKTSFTNLPTLLYEHPVDFFYLNGNLACCITVFFVTFLRYFGRVHFRNWFCQKSSVSDAWLILLASFRKKKSA